MKKNILITTTEKLQGLNIVEYRGYISASSAMGTGFFTELTSSFTDFAGGISSSIEEKIESLKDNVLRKLKEKARALKCNAIVGLRIDVDEISSGQKMMFMMTATGTAVRYVSNDDMHDLESVVDYEQLLDLDNSNKINEELSRILQSYKSNNLSDEKDFYELSNKIYESELRNFNIKDYLECLMRFTLMPYTFMFDVLDVLDSETVFKSFLELSYEMALNEKNTLISFSKSANFKMLVKRIVRCIDYQLLYEYISLYNKYFNIYVAYKLLEQPKEFYEQKDIEVLTNIAEKMKEKYYPNDPNANLSGKKICACGSVVAKNSECNCSNPDYISYNSFKFKLSVLKHVKHIIRLLKIYYQEN